MKLCDYWMPRPAGDPPGPCAAGPLRSSDQSDPLRCFRCGGWTPHGGLPSHERIAILAREVAGITARFAEDYTWAHGIAFAPTSRGGTGGGRRNGHSDPTLGVIADERRSMVRAYAAIAARLLEQAVRALRFADEAAGEALLAAEPPGPADHTPAPFHDPASLYPGRPDLADAHAARIRRQTRGEAIPT